MRKIQALVSIFILMGMLAITPARTAKAIVDNRYVATNGTDTGNNCLNIGTPCKTIIRAVGQATSGAIINIAAGTYKESNQITVNKNLTFNGAGMKKTFVDGNSSHRVFYINASVTVTIKNLTIRNGKASSSTGGGINSEGTLDLIKVKIVNNTATSAGGGLYVYSGSATLSDTAITKNKASNGAGIFGRVGDIALNRVEISENTATSNTGGIRYQANGGTLSLTNVTVSTNNGYTIGGISTGSGTTTNIHNSTIVDNHIDPTKTYGGISNSGTLTIESSIVAGNDNTQCNPGTGWVSIGYNAASDDSCDLFGINDFPHQIVTYGPLGNYGGFSRTHYLPPGSLALEDGNNANCPAVDQRGVSRPQDFNDTSDAGCDMGAFEATAAPQVYSITRDNPINFTTSANTVIFKVVFSEPVTNVTADDFSLVKTGSITGFSITNVNNVAGFLSYVTVNTGKYNGTLKLNVKNGTDIKDTDTSPKQLISGFTTGQIYNIKKTYTRTFRSQAKYDGWVLESGEFTNKGGTKNNTNNTLLVGDNNQDKQYRAILSFGTATIPDGAVITSAVLMIKKAGVVGKNPMSTHNGLVVDIKVNKFYTLPSLQINDFQAEPGKFKVGVFPKTLYTGQWYRAVLYKGARPYINKKGRTQIRIRYALDDNNDNVADILKLYSGNAIVTNRPKLIVKYYVP